jgi:ribosomal protein S18 acetylase RimI-like enzyme
MSRSVRCIADRRLTELERKLLDIQFLYELKVYDRGATDMSRAVQFMKTVDFDYKLEPGEWYLASLAVDPKWRRRGVGEMLTQWGLDQGQEEGVACALVASKMGEGLYKKMGFVVGERKNCLGLFDGTYMFWEPKGSEGQFAAQVYKGREDQIGKEL